jgi:hypothetical protein
MPPNKFSTRPSRRSSTHRLSFGIWKVHLRGISNQRSIVKAGRSVEARHSARSFLSSGEVLTSGDPNDDDTDNHTKKEEKH